MSTRENIRLIARAPLKFKKSGRCLFMEEGSLCLKCAATKVTNTYG